VTAAPLQTLMPTTDDGAPVMPRLVEMMRWQVQEGGGQAQLRLRPELLGPVTVTIVVEHGAVKAVVSAETPAALEYLRAESAGLQEALEERGLTLDEFEVREESPLAERRRDADDAPPRRETEAAPARRRERDEDGDAVFNVLM
jgi:flagellar hook-length control protein FliK